MARTRQEEREYIPQQIRWQIFKDCNETCAHCGKHLVFKQDFTLEHVIPLHKGGKNDISNYDTWKQGRDSCHNRHSGNEKRSDWCDNTQNDTAGKSGINCSQDQRGIDNWSGDIYT